MIDAGLRELLRCPVCRGRLDASTEAAGGLTCSSCRVTYPVVESIPDMVPGQTAGGDDGWKEWRAHLDGFQARREHRTEHPRGLISRLASKGSNIKTAFAEFTGVKSGRLLDVGCGPGKFRFRLPEAVEYYGVDPIPLPEASDFRFVRALAEHIPFPDGAFENMVVLAALDHFKDPPAFFAEARRVLGPTGRLHILQTLHEHELSMQSLAHMVKDALEDRFVRKPGAAPEAPHHMTEFDRSTIRTAFAEHFRPVAERNYRDHWYSPPKLFVTLASKDAEPAVH